MPKSLLGLLLTLILPILVGAETKNDLVLQSCASHVEPIITDWSGLDQINWQNITGHGRLKQNPIFTSEEIENIRKYISNGSDRLKTVGIVDTAQLVEAAGIQTAKKFTQYIDEIKANIAKRTHRKFWIDTWIRNEQALKFEGGHKHALNTLTVTRAERGKASWFAIGREIKEFSEPDDATVFTVEFHGGYPSAERLLIIVVVNFN